MEDGHNISDDNMLSSEGKSTDERSESEIDDVIVNLIYLEQTQAFDLNMLQTITVQFLAVNVLNR